MTTLPLSWRVQHTSDTSGTGTLALNPAAANRRSLFAASGGVAQAVGMVMAVPGTNQFEVGVPTYNGGNPGTLARGTPLFSSNGGAAVSFSGVIDCFPFDFPGQRRRASFPTTSTAGLSELGCFQTMTGSTNGTLGLPAVATVPPGAGYLIINRGTAGAWLTIDPNGSETINGATTLTLFAGESCEVFATSSGWLATGLHPIGLVRRQVASASAQIDFVLPAGFSDFEVRITDLRPATDGASLVLRTSVDSGVSFAAGGTDYRYMTEEPRPPSGGYASGRVGAATGIVVSMPLDTGAAANTCEGKIRVWTGDGTRQPQAFSEFSGVHNVQEYSTHRAMGNRLAGATINAIRLIFDTGNITAGTFTLYAVR